MELIDANELRDCFNINEYCEECYFNNHGGCDDKVLFTRLDVCKKIDDVDVIEAIPIEWLREKLMNHPELPYNITDGIQIVLDVWENEQGAR